jgi:prophage endopeptidase
MNPYIIIAIAAAWLVSLGAVGTWQHRAGATAERVEWQTREASELRAANALIADLQDAARRTEQAHAQKLAEIADRHQKEIRNAETRRKADVAAVRDGTLVLRDPGRAASEGACAGQPAAPGAAASQRDGGQAGRLSGEAAEFLLGLAADADAVADQLAACQAVILTDRASINQEGGDPR